jgi:hypothetical protein
MKGTINNINRFPDDSAAWLRADITQEQRLLAKAIAKKNGMTFQGWLGQLIKKELSSFSSPEASK